MKKRRRKRLFQDINISKHRLGTVNSCVKQNIKADVSKTLTQKRDDWFSVFLVVMTKQVVLDPDPRPALGFSRPKSRRPNPVSRTPDQTELYKPKLLRPRQPATDG